MPDAVVTRPSLQGAPLYAAAAMTTALVTGGAGFIGSNLVDALVARGDRVSVIDDLSTGSLSNLEPVRDNPALRVITARISACRELKEIVSRAESVYHLAAGVGVELVVNSPIHVLQTSKCD